MNSNRHEHEKDVTVFSNPECILRDKRRAAATSSVTTPVGNPPIAPQLLDAALEKAVTQIPRAEGEETFDGLADRPVTEERAASRIQPTPFASLVRSENTMRKQIISILDLVEDAVMCLLSYAARAWNQAGTQK